MYPLQREVMRMRVPRRAPFRGSVLGIVCGALVVVMAGYHPTVPAVCGWHNHFGSPDAPLTVVGRSASPDQRTFYENLSSGPPTNLTFAIRPWMLSNSSTNDSAADAVAIGFAGAYGWRWVNTSTPLCTGAGGMSACSGPRTGWYAVLSGSSGGWLASYPAPGGHWFIAPGQGWVATRITVVSATNLNDTGDVLIVYTGLSQNQVCTSPVEFYSYL